MAPDDKANASKSIKVLIVEDEEDDALLTLRALARAGYDPMHRRVDNAEAFVEALAEAGWDVVLCDNQLPDFNAARALEIFKQDDREIPFIIVSGKIGEESAVEFMKAGASNFVPKDHLERLGKIVALELSEFEGLRALKKAEAALRGTEARLTALATQLPGVIYRRIEHEDGGRTYPYISPGLYDLLGYPAEDVMSGKLDPISDCVAPEDQARVKEAVTDSGKALTPLNIEYRMVAADGEIKWVNARAQPERTPDGSMVWNGLLLDITDRKAAEQRVEYVTNYDMETGLPNRTLFLDRLTQAMKAARRDNSNLAVLAIGLTRMQIIEQSIGRSAASAALPRIAERVAEVIPSDDSLARIAPDTFAILHRESGELEKFIRLIEQMMSRLNEPIDFEDAEIVPGASVGVAFYPSDSEDATKLIQQAQMALHEAAEQGPGNYRYFTQDLQVRASIWMTLESRLRHALENDEFDVHYQPIIDLKTNRLAGAEALARWRQTTGKLISPAEFIPLAEECGLIRKLGLTVLRKACAQIKAWKAKGLEIDFVAVNISARQLMADSKLVTEVGETLRDYDVDPGKLKFELTESALAEDMEQALRLLETLRAMGASLSIDDFGTGYSSLGYLTQFRVSDLKLDRTFVVGIMDDSERAAIVNTVITLSHILGMTVTAEGIEEPDQLTVLRAFGCDRAQGFLLSKPIPGEEMTSYLRSDSPEYGRIVEI